MVEFLDALQGIVLANRLRAMNRLVANFLDQPELVAEIVWQQVLKRWSMQECTQVLLVGEFERWFVPIEPVDERSSAKRE